MLYGRCHSEIDVVGRGGQLDQAVRVWDGASLDGALLKLLGLSS